MPDTAANPADPAPVSTAWSILVGLASLAILLQGVWAGIFLEHDGQRDAASTWIDVHSWGGNAATLFALAATVVAVITMRRRRDLWIGSLVLLALLVLETVLGGQIRDAHRDTLTAVHVPLAMILMGVAVWLPLRARRS